ncbi:MAG: pyridoxal phosphate-dependent aminotransferase [Rikenellaceae bacterium]|nr:pyridoxal phosphate-dependent aminotransferase [Rikenellaceae bacterium]
MPHISVKGEKIPASPIRKLVPFAEDAKRRGIKVYHLNIGQPDIPTPEVALEAVKNINVKVIEYSHSAGIESYRRKLVQYYNKVGIDINYEQMIITNGGSEALMMAMNVCLDSGDEVLVPEPFYANYNGFAVQSDVVIRPITSTIENNFALPSIEDFERHITPRTKAILICNPNNPTGYLYSKKELEQLRDIILRYDLFLFSDEVYKEFCYDGEEYHSVLNLEGVDENVVMIDSVSKRYSMCGVRVGAIISRNKEVIKSALKVAQARLCPPYFSQVAAEAAIDAPKEYFEEVYDEYLKRRNFLVENLNKIEGVYCPTPKGAFYTLARLPIDDCDRFARWLLEEFEYDKQTVMVAPATGFYATKCLGLNEVRLAYVLNIDDLRSAIKCIEEALKVYPGRTNK